MFKKLTLLIALAFGLCWSGISDMMAQNVPDEYIYFDLAAGDVIFSGGNYTGYVYVNGTSTQVNATHNDANKYYIYQSSTKSGNNDKSHTGYASTEDFSAHRNCRVPNYPAVAYGGQAWSDYITDNSDVDAVQVHWIDAISDTDRTGTENRICFRNNGTYNVILDNIYTTYEINGGERRTGGITVGYTEAGAVASAFLSDCKVTLKLKGDNRVGNIYYYSGSETNKSELHLTSAEGNGSKSGSITVASYVTDFDMNNTSCIGCGVVIGNSGNNAYSYRTYFDGGTVFAGMPKCGGTGVWSGQGHVTHVIGSRQATGVIVNGGKLTAVSNSTAAAIGGGGGYISAGGQATVDINGGYVYAYNHSIYSDQYNCFVPCVAIGGSSSVEKSAELTTINIRGGHVFAQSMGGCAIGGGGSAKKAGGPANINISGDAYVEAKSLGGSIGGHSFPAGTSIGGGTAGTDANMNGGYAIFQIDGGTLRAGSIGGGSTLSSTGKVGYVEAYITDGDVQAQFMMAAGSTEHCVFEMSGGTLHGSDYTSTSYPLVKNNGGAVWMDDPNGVATISGGEIYDNNASNGGAFYMTGGQLNITGGKIYGNTAATNGGSAYMGGGNFEMSNGEVSGNTANTSGGGFYVNGGSITITGGEVMNNTATSGNGGGFYSAGGTVNISNAEISGNHADNGFGGGLYSAAAITVGGETEESGATISGNEAKNGGGFYVAGADDATTTIQSSSIVSNNRATVNGAGAFIESGNLTVKSSDINGNTADGNGGGFYVQGGLSTITGGTVQYNTATNGGGLYMKGTSGDSAVAEFEYGTFQYNVARNNGGGIYLASNSALTMSGDSHIVTNHVSNVSGHGGGVMVDGGQLIIIGGEGSSLKVDGNYVGESTNNSNNVYLNGANDYITIDKDHGTPTGITVGISINGNDIPKKVVYCEDATILNNISEMIKQALSSGTDNSIFDDAHRYESLISAESPFEDHYLYFVRVWPVDVTEAELNALAAVEGIKYIDTPRKLTTFMMLANGYKDGFDSSDLEGVITADLEMGGSLWIPIGGSKDASGNSIPFTGSLDGGGHVISNLVSAGLMNYNDYGLFGKTDGAEIKNIVIENCNFVSGEARRMGALICDMKGGKVENCMVSGKVIASGSETYSYQVENPETHEMEDYYDPLYCVVGGLIGEASSNASGNAQIINCMSTVEVEALPKEPVSMYPRSQKITVGGLVGMTSSGTVIRNSYAHAKISHRCETRTGIEGSGYNDPTDLGRYVGGLVGINNGEITNCYVRFQEGTLLDLGEGSNNSSLFGIFAGNNAGSISYCYAPDENLFSSSRSYVNNGTAAGVYGDFNTTVTPYYYKHNDNLVTLNGASETSGSLLDKLNEWVDNQSTSKDAPAISYSRWMRTCASPINADYPVLEYDNLSGTLGYTTIASRDGINMEYNKSLDKMLGEYNATGALFVFKTPDEEIETSSAMPLYVGEDVALQLKQGTELSNAYVGITLDNSAASKTQFNWHMFSTPLDKAPLGVDYEGNTTTYNYWNGQTLPQFNFYTESDYDGYFPSKDFGGNNYYTDWDYYCYYEPAYHWINFKRNSASHFHEDTENPDLAPHAQIIYDNEATLDKGKGYLLATKEETFLQSHGTLNNGDVKITLSKTDDVQPYFQGYNLIGNPYQAYLNFSETGLGSYVILDEDAGGYVAYTNRASKNAYPAASPTKDGGEVPAPGQFLHMHQGFFVVAASDDQKVTLRPDMCVTNASSTFRGEEQPAYPLVNLAVTEADGSREFVTIELDRPDNGGAAKLKGLRNGTSLIYTSIDGEDYSIAFMPAGTTSAAVRFETLEEGTFTMNWNTQNGTFSYLHLIDNMTGMDIDCLASDEYKFTASPDDYASRFKLVFSYTGVEENESASMSSASFAFMMNGNLVVNGEGMADIFDLTGRLVSSTRLAGAQSTISLPAMAQGIYTIRLTNGNGSKVQKMVIK